MDRVVGRFMADTGTALALLACVACGCAPRGARTPAALHVVVIRKIAFEPADLPAAVGDTIEWRNEDLVPHTVSAADSSWDSGDLKPDRQWRRVVDRAGTIAYGCRYHPTMRAVLRIGAPAAR